MINYEIRSQFYGAVREVLTTKAQKAHEGNIDAKSNLYCPFVRLFRLRGKKFLLIGHLLIFNTGKLMNEIKQLKNEVNNKINFFKNRKNWKKIIGTIAIIVIAVILAFNEKAHAVFRQVIGVVNTVGDTAGAIDSAGNSINAARDAVNNTINSAGE